MLSALLSTEYSECVVAETSRPHKVPEGGIDHVSAISGECCVYSAGQQRDAVTEEVEQSQLRIGRGIERGWRGQQRCDLVGRDEADPSVLPRQCASAEPHHITGARELVEPSRLVAADPGGEDGPLHSDAGAVTPASCSMTW